MFSGFQTATDVDSQRRYAITSVIALVVLVALGGAVWAITGEEEQEEEEEVDEIDVAFQAPEAEPEPEPIAPPPPPPTTPKPAAPSAPKKVSTAPPPPPKVISEQELKKEDASKFTADSSSGGGDMVAGPPGGDVGGLGGIKETKKPAAPPPPPPKVEKKIAKTGPIAIPENATPPKPLAGNAPPAYPDAARAAGMEGVVFLKIVIEKDGSVGAIEVKKGDEPFVSAAVAAVKTWKYSPALLDGEPIAVYRIIKVPFTLKN